MNHVVFPELQGISGEARAQLLGRALADGLKETQVELMTKK